MADTPVKPDRRAGDQGLDARIEGAVRRVMDDQNSLKKNGHTWAQYLEKMITPDRVLMVILLGFTLGGRLSDAQRELRDATKQASEASETAAQASEQAIVAAQQVAATTQTLSDVRAEMDAITKALKAADIAREELGSRLMLAVTRGEFQAVVKQQIVPRLDRIEQRLDDKP